MCPARWVLLELAAIRDPVHPLVPCSVDPPPKPLHLASSWGREESWAVEFYGLGW